MSEFKKQSLAIYSSKNCIDMLNCTFQWFSVPPALPNENDDENNNNNKNNNNNNNNNNKKKKEEKEKTSNKKETLEQNLEYPTFILTIPSLTIQYGELIIVCGTIGQGKSSLCQALLGEMKMVDNLTSHYYLSGTLSYASQLAWIQNTTIRQNIIYNKQFDKEKYYRVIHACCLLEDFQSFPLSDHTFIGQKGINLSGGQKSRIALARALYLDQEIYILDDVFAALDSIVGRKVFERVICGLLKSKTRILVTHKDEIINHNQVNQILTLTNGNLACEKKQQFIQQINTTQSIEQINYEILPEEYKLMDELIMIEPPNFRNHKSSTVELPDLENNSPRNYSYEYTNSSSLSLNSSSQIVTPDSILSIYQSEEEKESGSVSLTVYTRYAQAAGGFYIIGILVFVQTTWQLLGVGSDFFITHWSKEDSDEQKEYLDKNILIYASLAIGSGFIVLVRTVTISYFGYYASKNLFSSMLQSLLHAPMWWIDKNPSGRYLYINYFTLVIILIIILFFFFFFLLLLLLLLFYYFILVIILIILFFFFLFLLLLLFYYCYYSSCY